jgi:formate C-acetyltransferase
VTGGRASTLTLGRSGRGVQWPYRRGGEFLAGATARTERIWATLNAQFVEERKKRVLELSQIPSSITAHAPGYIDRESEVIVGLQTEAPLRRAIMPKGACAWC